jgi:hypothetical protein
MLLIKARIVLFAWDFIFIVISKSTYYQNLEEKSSITYFFNQYIGIKEDPIIKEDLVCIFIWKHNYESIS